MNKSKKSILLIFKNGGSISQSIICTWRSQLSLHIFIILRRCLALTIWLLMYILQGWWVGNTCMSKSWYSLCFLKNH